MENRDKDDKKKQELDKPLLKRSTQYWNVCVLCNTTNLEYYRERSVCNKCHNLAIERTSTSKRD